MHSVPESFIAQRNCHSPLQNSHEQHSIKFSPVKLEGNKNKKFPQTDRASAYNFFRQGRRRGRPYLNKHVFYEKRLYQVVEQISMVLSDDQQPKFQVWDIVEYKALTVCYLTNSDEDLAECQVACKPTAQAVFGWLKCVRRVRIHVCHTDVLLTS